ncbi:MAG: sodium-dependent transporter [Longimicrobiales bacterium]
MPPERPRDRFITRWGFILACAGSAVGLGNLWMFPWRLGAYGGAAFLIPYLIFVYVLGTTGLMGEFAFGRWAGKGAMGAYDKVLRERGLSFGRALGAYPVLTLFGTLIFYLIVTGWVLRYLFAALDGDLLRDGAADEFFNRFAGHPESVRWQLLAALATGGVLVFGIGKGIERASKLMMPLLLALLFVLLVRSLTLPGAMRGLEYLLVPDWSYLLKPITWGMALGQAFFSVSLTGSGMLVYGSYLTSDFDVPHAALSTVTLDTTVAIMAAFIIMPATFAYGIDPAAGPPLLFITLVSVFGNMPLGGVMAILFFLGVLFAALTSLLAIAEVVVEALMDQFSWGRRGAVGSTAILAFLCGLPLAVDQARFDDFVDLVTVYLVPVGAAIAGVLFFWVLGTGRAREEVNVGAGKSVGAWWEPVARYLFVGVAILIVGLQIAFRIG